MNKEELLNYQLKKDDFETTMDGVLIKYNSHIIKKIMNDQLIVKRINKRLAEMVPELKKAQKKRRSFMKGYEEITTEKGRAACDFGLAQTSAVLEEVKRVIKEFNFLLSGEKKK